MKEKFTPGPWIASDYYCDSTTIIDGSGFSVADAPRLIIREGWSDMGFQHWAYSAEAHRWISEDEQRANANLIAAAPELLSALQEVIKSLEITLRVGYERIIELGGECDSPEVMIKGHSEIARAKQVIAKALGESQ